MLERCGLPAYFRSIKALAPLKGLIPSSISDSLNCMSSYRPRVSHPSRLRGKRPIWRRLFKLFLWLVIAGFVYWGIEYCYTTVRKWREPHYITVESQKEAMDKLSSMMELWSGSNEELLQAATDWENRMAWMKDPRARLAATRLLAAELENRGLRSQFRKLQLSLVTRDLASSASLPAEERKLVLKHALDVAGSMAGHGDDADAESLYGDIVKAGSAFDAHAVAQATDALVGLASKRGATKEVQTLIDSLNGKVDINALKEPDLIRKVAGLFLLSDKITRQTEGGEPRKGRELARTLLINAKLTSSPEWGVISLLDIEPELKNPGTTGIASLCKTLEDALICFRSSTSEDLRFCPEIMLAIAQLKLQDGQLEPAILWAGRAEGAALALGVDMPRILEVGSIKNGVAALRSEYRQQMEKRAALKEVRDSLHGAGVKLAGEQWDSAIDEAKKTSVLAGKIGTFADGYIPASLMVVGKAYEGKKKWEEAASVYADLAKGWESLEGEILKTAEENMARLKYNDFYKTVIRRLAAVFRKQDMITKSRETLKRIGEGEGEEVSPPATRESRRSRRG